MKSDYKYQIVTEEFSNEILKKDLKELIFICKVNNISDVIISFGYAWQDFMNNRTPYKINVDSILGEVKKVEKRNFGILGEDDLSIIFDDFKIRFCHHGDIHLIYNEMNDIIEEIIKNWNNKKWTFKNNNGYEDK